MKKFLENFLFPFIHAKGTVFLDALKSQCCIQILTPIFFENFMELGSIERASKNTPIQGSSADMTKLALVYIMQHIEDNNLPIKIVMTVHDQIDTICPVDLAEEWKEQMSELMEKAAKAVIKNGLLKSDTTITEKWSK